MQRADLIRQKKWAMEEAFLREVGVRNSRAATSMRSWSEPWEVSTENRDRPGGHKPARYYRPWKKVDKRKARREHVRITAEAVREFYEDHELYLQEMAALYEDFWDDDCFGMTHSNLKWTSVPMISRIATTSSGTLIIRCDR